MRTAVRDGFGLLAVFPMVVPVVALVVGALVLELGRGFATSEVPDEAS